MEKAGSEQRLGGGKEVRRAGTRVRVLGPEIYWSRFFKAGGCPVCSKNSNGVSVAGAEEAREQKIRSEVLNKYLSGE